MRAALQAWLVVVTLAGSVGAALVLNLTGVLGGGEAVLFAVATAAFQVEEVLRRVLMAVTRFWTLLVVDGVAVATTLLSLLLVDEIQVGSFLLSVAVGQAAGILVAVAVLPRAERRLVPLRGAALREVIAFGGWRGAQVALTPTGLTISRFVLLGATGAVALGEVEAGRILGAPALLVVQGLGSYLLSTYARDRALPLETLKARARRASLAMAGTAVALGVVVTALTPFLAPLAVGRSIDVHLVTVAGWALFAAATATMQPFASLAVTRGSQRAVFGLRALDVVVGTGLLALALGPIGLAAPLTPLVLAVGPRPQWRPRPHRRAPDHRRRPRRRPVMNALRTSGVGRLALAALVVTLGLVVPAAPAASADEPAVVDTVGADALPTWQINGVVWSQAIVGTTVYVTGSFTKARPPGVPVGGAGEIAAQNIFAYDVTTGNPVGNFSHALNAQGLVVRASADGSRVYVGGDFTTVDGAARGHVAAFRHRHRRPAQLGPEHRRPGPRPRGGGRHRLRRRQLPVGQRRGAQPPRGLPGLQRPDDRLGPRGRRHRRLRLDDGDEPRPDPGHRRRLLRDAQRHRRVRHGRARRGHRREPPVGGPDQDPHRRPQRRHHQPEGRRDQRLRRRGTPSASGASFEGTFAADPDGGAIRWVNDCLGDTYDVESFQGSLYSVAHAHDCSVIDGFGDTSPRSRWQKAQASSTEATGMTTRNDAYGWDFRGYAFAGLRQWYPDLEFGSYTPDRQAAWAVEGSGDYLVLGGEFPTVNGTAQQGLVRFLKKSVGPHSFKPIYLAGMDPVATSTESGEVRVRFNSTWDRDDETLTYDVYRDNGPSIGSVTSSSVWWKLPPLVFTDTGRTPGVDHTYRVRAKDSTGNVQWSNKSAAVTVSAATPSSYSALVRGDGAQHLWRFENGTTPSLDSAGATDLTLASTTTTTGVAGSGALSSTGGSNPKAYAAFAEPKPSAVTLEAWVKTTSTRGGRIIGLGSSSANSSSSYDLALYLGDNGRVNFGVKNAANALVTTTSTQAVNDGTWHHVAAVVDAGGSSIVIDGKRSGRSQTGTGGPDFRGYWRVLGDSTSGLGNRPTDLALSGAVDEVAVYTSALPIEKLRSHYTAVTGVDPTPAAQTDTYGARVQADGPDAYWRLGEANGSTARDSSSVGQRRVVHRRLRLQPARCRRRDQHRRDASTARAATSSASRPGARPPRTARRRGSRPRPPVVAGSSGSAARRTPR